jgi:hypothetical protein
MTKDAVLVLNPIRFTLQHYERELSETLWRAGYHRVDLIEAVAGEGVVGTASRLRIAVASVVERTRLGLMLRGRTVIVVWPLFGYLDPCTLWSVCRHNRVLVVMHDPTPLRRSYGYSRLARRLFKWVVTATDTQVIYHTRLAQVVGGRECGVVGTVAPHPIATGVVEPDAGSTASGHRPIVRVMGQYKWTRSVAPMVTIGARESTRLQLEIHGRGWPTVDGWVVSERFVPEDEFIALLRSSDCVVIPYDSFFQSGVAVRCLELGVRVVAPRHEHIEELFGPDWPGLVRGESDWCDAVLRVLAVDPADLAARASEVRDQVTEAWRQVLGGECSG